MIAYSNLISTIGKLYMLPRYYLLGTVSQAKNERYVCSLLAACI
jgi:hypothetical protein